MAANMKQAADTNINRGGSPQIFGLFFFFFLPYSVSFLHWKLFPRYPIPNPQAWIEHWQM
uniref:Uncharacterized protein n=1 Tax=Candidozyma auris TaxID=498019 RepID=A0A0L0P5M1_CANAR